MLKTRSLLLIEDDNIDQMAFRLAMKDTAQPYQYQIAGSLAEVRVLLTQQTFDIIVTDHHLGDGTAFDVLALRPDVPIVVITGAGSERIAIDAMKAGAYDYLNKDSQRTYLALLPTVVENALKRRQIEHEAAQFQRERIRRETLQSFIRDASHDLRTPLTNCGTSLYILRRYTQQLQTLLAAEPLNSAMLRDIAQHILDRIGMIDEARELLERIILDMLEMVRIDNLTHLDCTHVNCAELVQRLLQTYEGTAAAHDQRLVLTSPPEPVWAWAMEDDLQVALTALLKNALAYTPSGGTVTISVAANDGQAMITIHDTGIGIAPEHLPHIFERFYRVDAARTGAVGVGLGLSIAQRIIALHEGRITVTSAVNEGSIFTVLLPSTPPRSAMGGTQPNRISP